MRSGFPSARASEPRGFDAPEADTGGRLSERGMGDLATRVPVICLGQEDPLEEGMAAHSSILAWKIPWMDRETLAGGRGPQR